jgi:hypothetical protein
MHRTEMAILLSMKLSSTICRPFHKGYRLLELPLASILNLRIRKGRLSLLLERIGPKIEREKPKHKREGKLKESSAKKRKKRINIGKGSLKNRLKYRRNGS